MGGLPALAMSAAPPPPPLPPLERDGALLEGVERRFPDGAVAGLRYSFASVRHRRWARFHVGRTVFEVRMWQEDASSNEILLIVECEALILRVSPLSLSSSDRARYLHRRSFQSGGRF